MAEIARFFKVKASSVSGYHSTLIKDDGSDWTETVTTIDEDGNEVTEEVSLGFNFLRRSKEIFNGPSSGISGYEDISIVHIQLSDEIQKAITDYTGYPAASMESVMALEISSSYCGYEYTDKEYCGLFWFCPELKGTKVTGKDEDGNDTEVDIVMEHKWTGAK